MRKFNPSWGALALASAALFTTLGGPAWAAGLINGSQIKNGSITSRKIGRGQVRTVNLAPGAVTGSKVAARSLTAADVAPNTFLAANGTAANSARLGGLPASSFIRGTGNLLRHSIVIPVGTSSQLLVDVGLGEVDASCLAGPKAQVSFTAEAQPDDLVESGTTIEHGAEINSMQNMSTNSTFTQPDSSLLDTIDFEVSNGINLNPSRVATIWTTGDVSGGGTECIFTAEAVTTGV